MTSQKNWKNVYAEQNPFELPQAISRRLRGLANDGDEAVPEDAGLDYLWLHVANESVEGEYQGRHMTVDDWCNVIDETAALGAKKLVITTGSCLCHHPEVWAICRWAQEQHGMLTGVHVRMTKLGDFEMGELMQLDADKTRLFVDGENLEAYLPVRALGIHVQAAVGLPDGEPQPMCMLPHTMTCVGSDGAMYTCGLVLGQRKFALGDVSQQRVDKAMADKALPHEIPPNTAEGSTGRCNGCPPLLDGRRRT